MTLALFFGGARSGKSHLAVHLAREFEGEVVFVATGWAGDGEMRERIAKHRSERPSHWRTVEEPVHLERAIRGLDDNACVIVDCLSMWLSNRLEHGTDADVLAEAAAAAAASSARAGPTIAVSIEVGLGIVPMHPVGRRYRDLLGEVNAMWVRHAQSAFFVLGGRAIRLESPPKLSDLEP